MSQNNIYVRLKTLMGTTQKEVSKLNQSYDKLNSSTKKVNNNHSSLQNKLKKTNDSFSNLSKDANRAGQSIGSLGGKFLSLGNIIRGVGLYKIGDIMYKSIQSTIDMAETINLFNVAMGDMAESTNDALSSISKFTGLDHTNLQDRVGTYNLLARSMGLSSENSKILSENTARLALDLSSLTNVSINQVSADLRSGLVGQSETMYKYGVDVTEASLKVEALAQGISKSVRNMSQGEKMALRYSVMLRQTALAHGDFANTINNPANQLKILADRFVTLGRAVGTMFVPALTVVLPYLNALVSVLTDIILKIGLLLGYKPTDTVKNTNSGFGVGEVETPALGGFDDGGSGGGKDDKFGGVTGGAKKATKAIKGTEEQAKKLKKQLSGFDEINTLGQPEIEDKPSGADDDDAGAGGGSGGGKGAGAGSGGGVTGGGGSGGGMDMGLASYDGLLDEVRQKSDELVEGIKAGLDKLLKILQPTIDALKRLWDEGLSLFGKFTFQALLDFYEYFLIPIGTWVMGIGLPRFIDAINDMLKKIDWGKLLNALRNLWDSLAPFTVNVGEGLLWLWERVLLPLSAWTISNILPIFIDALASGIDILNGIIEAFMPIAQWLFDNFLLPIASWTGGIIVSVLESLGNALKFVGDNINIILPIVAGLGTLLALWQLTELMAYVKFLTGANGFTLLANTIGHVSSIALGQGVTAFTGLLAPIKLLGSSVAILGKSFGTFLISPLGLIALGVLAVITVGVLLWKNWDTIKEKASEIWDKIESTVVKIWDNMKDSASKTWDNMKTKITDIWESIGVFFSEKVPEIIKNVVEWFSELPYKVGFELGKIAGTIATWVVNAVGWVVVGVPKIVKKIVDYMAELPSKIGQKIDQFKETLSTWVNNSVQWVVVGVPKIVKRIVDFMAELPSKIRDKLNIFKTTLSTWVSDSVGWVKTELPRLLNNIIDWFGKLPSSLVNVGKNMIKGIWNGMKSMGSWLAGRFKGFFGGAWEFVSDVFKGFGNGFQASFSPNIRLARGGSLSAGQYFEAGEGGHAELVGNYQGKTTVMPLENSGFVSAMKSAVIEGVTSAMNSSGGGSSGGTPIIVNVGGKTLVDTVVGGINRESRIKGKSIITV